MGKISRISYLRSAALVVLLVGAVWSLSLTLQAGKNNDSTLPKILFSAWVLSPYMIQLVAFIISKKWTKLRRFSLYLLTILLSIVSLVYYSGLLTLPNAKPAAVYLIVPLSSWLLIAIMFPLTAYFSRMLTRMKENV